MRNLYVVVLIIVALAGFYFFLSFLGTTSWKKKPLNHNDMGTVFYFIEKNGYYYDDDQVGKVVFITLPKRVLNGPRVRVYSKDGEKFLIIDSKQVEIVTNYEGKIIRAWSKWGVSSIAYFSETNPWVSLANEREIRNYQFYQKTVIRYLQKKHWRQVKH